MKLKPQPKTAFSGFNPPEDALQNLLDSTPFAMFSVDRNYRYTAFNRAHARMMNLIYGAGIEPGCSLLDYMTVAEDRQKAKQNLDRALAGEAFTDSAYSGEESLSRLFFDVHHMPVRDDQGAVIGASVYSEDVTGLKRAAEDLKNSEDLFRASFMFASIGVTLVSPNDKFLRANPAFCDMLGYSETELSGMTIEDLTFEEDKPASLSFMKNACAGLVNNAHYEKRYIRKDGSFFWADVSSTAFRNDAGELQYLIMHVEDITRAKKVQAELLEHQTRLDELVQQRTRQLSDSETLYRSLFDTISSVIVIFNPDTGRILDANPAACVLFERSYAELINSDMMDMVKMQPSDVQTHAGKILSGEKIFLEAGLRRADGEMRFLGAYPGLIQFKHGPAVLAVLHDITEAKRAEQALQENEALFRASFENATVGVSLVGPDGRFLHVNHKLCDILGYTPEELANMTFNDVTYPEDQDNGSLFGNPDVTGEKDGLRAEKRCVHKDGHMLWVIISFAAVRNPAGELQYFVTHTQDITDHKQLEDKLRQQSRAVESSPASIVITNINGNIEYVNPQFTIQTGYTIKEVAGKNPRILKSGLMPESLYENLWNTILAGNIWRGELQNKKKNCELYWERVSISAIRNAEGTIINFVAVKEDISEHKKKEELIVEGRAKLQAALASMSDAVFISDTRGNFIHYNDAFATFHRFKNKEECARTFDEYPQFLEVYSLSGELVPAENWAVPRALRGETGTGVEFRLLRKDSGETWVGSYNYAPICDKEGLIVGSVVTGRDISKSKASEAKIKDYVKQLENAMQGTLQAVANVVEAHDPYTAGHERRVGIISADIAREMGWSEEKCNTLNLIGLVHDIGKMSIPAEILSKPGRLSAIEFQLVKTHAEEGYEILKDVEFPLPIAEIIREHHERMDGSGYPHGLKGEEALIESRILAVADVLEAIASHRPYRPSLGIDAAISEIESQRGSLFDPEVVDAMLRLFREKAYQLPD